MDILGLIGRKSRLKHVRSEKAPFTLMRMIDVNIENTDKTLLSAIEMIVKKEDYIHYGDIS